MANLGKPALAVGSALLAVGCGVGSPAASPAAKPVSVRATASAKAVPEQWRLVRASADLRAITLAVPACRRVAQITARESSTLAVITVYADPGTTCGWQPTGQRTVSLAQPISCERIVVDGSTGRPPALAEHADAASVTFACPASS
ncbi:MAG TPA: hypothetical protein VGG75_04940 [Trebonia sp.]|jgi:hypothetical protein